MLCKKLQTKIAVHDPLTLDERLHAEDCPHCAAFETSLESRLFDWRVPAEAPLRRRPSARTPR